MEPIYDTSTTNERMKCLCNVYKEQVVQCKLQTWNCCRTESTTEKNAQQRKLCLLVYTGKYDKRKSIKQGKKTNDTVSLRCAFKLEPNMWLGKRKRVSGLKREKKIHLPFVMSCLSHSQSCTTSKNFIFAHSTPWNHISHTNETCSMFTANINANT